MHQRFDVGPSTAMCPVTVSLKHPISLMATKFKTIVDKISSNVRLVLNVKS